MIFFEKIMFCYFPEVTIKSILLKIFDYFIALQQKNKIWGRRLFQSYISDFFPYAFCTILKVGLSPSKKTFLFASIDSPSKMMKNAFYFILKALFVLIIFKFLSWLFGLEEKTAGLGKQVNFDIYDVTAWITKN